MVTARVTSKGQVTIPKSVREALGLATGDKVDFAVDSGHATIRPARKGDLMRLYGILGGRVTFVSREAERESAMKQAVREALDLPDDADVDVTDI